MSLLGWGHAIPGTLEVATNMGRTSRDARNGDRYTLFTRRGWSHDEPIWCHDCEKVGCKSISCLVCVECRREDKTFGLADDELAGCGTETA